MNLGSREDVINFIKNSGATLYDLAAKNNTTPENVIKYLKELEIPLPSMALDGSFDFIKSLQSGIRTNCTDADLLSGNTSITSLKIPNKVTESYSAEIIERYKAVHGSQITDPYSKEILTEDDLTPVDGNPENYLVTNIEALSAMTYSERFNHAIGPVKEVFKLSTNYFDFELEICRKYDQCVGGTYNPDYIHNLFYTWVGYPVNLYFKQNLEDEVIFKHKTPMYIAWWTWTQLSNYALLKGLHSIKVTSKTTYSLEQFASKESIKTAGSMMTHQAIVTYKDVLVALDSSVMLERLRVLKKKERSIQAQVTM